MSINIILALVIGILILIIYAIFSTRKIKDVKKELETKTETIEQVKKDNKIDNETKEKIKIVTTGSTYDDFNAGINLLHDLATKNGKSGN